MHIVESQALTENNIIREHFVDNIGIINKKQENQRRRKLLNLAKSVLYSLEHHDMLVHLMKILNLKEEVILQRYLDYNLDIYSFGNEIFNSLETRFVLHIHNLLKGSWHQERQQVVCDYVRTAAPRKAIDVGFGVPMRYIRDVILQDSRTELTLCDFSESAFQFAEALLTTWDKEWRSKIKFICADMQDIVHLEDYDLYLFQDSIEHVPDPTDCLTRYVDCALPNAQFILSLPIGRIIPAHYIAWESVS